MNEYMVTFGMWMGLEAGSKQDTDFGGAIKDALLVFCPTIESQEAEIPQTPRMRDLGLMGFEPVAIIRGNPEDTREYVILRKENLSAKLRNAVLEEAARVVRDTSEGIELRKSCSGNKN